MTHDELISVLDDYSVGLSNGFVHKDLVFGVAKALRAVVELHTPATANSFTNNDCICMMSGRQCATIWVIEKALQ